MADLSRRASANQFHGASIRKADSMFSQRSQGGGASSGNQRASFSISSPAIGKSSSSAATPSMSHPHKMDGSASGTAATVEKFLQVGQPKFDTYLDFIKVNRAVAVIERAVERLELLQLLDPGSSLPGEEGAGTLSIAPPSPRKLKGNGGSGLGITGSTASLLRGAAILPGPGRQTTIATAPQVVNAIAATTELKQRGRPSVKDLLMNQRRLEARYGELLLLIQQKVSIRPGEPHLNPLCLSRVKDPVQVALQKELVTISAQLRDTNRMLCTQLKDNPQDADNWAKVSNERREVISLLQEAVSELTAGYKESQNRSNSESGGPSGADSSFVRPSMAASDTTANTTNRNSTFSATASGAFPPGSGGSIAANGTPSGGAEPSSVLRRFGSTVQRRQANRNLNQQPRIPLLSSYTQFAVKVLQEEAAQQWADEIVKKERSLNQNVKQLQSDLIKERDLKAKETAVRQARVAALRIQLRNLKRELRLRSDAAKEHDEAATEGLQRQAEMEVNDVQKEIERTDLFLQIEGDTHSVFAAHLKERTAAMDSLAAEWEVKAQRELKKIEAKKIDAESSRQVCAQRLSDLGKEKGVQQDLQSERVSQHQKEEEQMRVTSEKKSAEYYAASVLEAALKAMMTRQALKKLRKGSKKGKKKKAQK